MTTTCRCGRPLNPSHCPRCGRKWIVAVKSLGVFDTLTTEDGSKYRKYYQGYRCRSCGAEWETLTITASNCEAPLLPIVVKKTKENEAREQLKASLAKAGGNRVEVLRKILEKELND
jgi:DNA-directed RNA polymerase subunit RPC12/RpoP